MARQQETPRFIFQPTQEERGGRVLDSNVVLMGRSVDDMGPQGAPFGNDIGGYGLAHALRAIGFRGFIGDLYPHVTQHGKLTVIVGLTDPDLYEQRTGTRLDRPGFSSRRVPRDRITPAEFKRGMAQGMRWICSQITPQDRGELGMYPHSLLEVGYSICLQDRAMCLALAKGLGLGHKSADSPRFVPRTVWVKANGPFTPGEKALRRGMLMGAWKNPDTTDFDGFLESAAA